MGGEKTTVFISYNQVNGFRSGWHSAARVFVCANDNGRGTGTGKGEDERARAGSVMHQISGQYYRGAVPADQVGRYYIYAGLYAMGQAIDIARSLKTQNRAPVTVVACDCDRAVKANLLRGTGIDIVWCECGGERTMGRLAEAVLEAA